jgi:hypothetical protein
MRVFLKLAPGIFRVAGVWFYSCIKGEGRK